MKRLLFIPILMFSIFFLSCSDDKDPKTHQCCAITNAGKRCSRNASEGPFDYKQNGEVIGKYYVCWQHVNGTINWYYPN